MQSIRPHNEGWGDDTMCRRMRIKQSHTRSELGVMKGSLFRGTRRSQCSAGTGNRNQIQQSDEREERGGEGGRRERGGEWGGEERGKRGKGKRGEESGEGRGEKKKEERAEERGGGERGESTSKLVPFWFSRPRPT